MVQKRHTRLGAEFYQELLKYCSIIDENPLLYSEFDEQSRACSLKRFPYTIHYRLKDSRIQILAVAHKKQRPNYWSHRVKS